MTTNGGCATTVKPAGTLNCARCSANAAFDGVLGAASSPQANDPPPTTASSQPVNQPESTRLRFIVFFNKTVLNAAHCKGRRLDR